ncbi:MAG: biopolymer transporter ExbD [Planctomycetota bacterium]
MKIRTEADNGTVFDLTPMIDCVFLLLIFFMVATTYLNLEKEMDINLPDAAAARPEEMQPEEIIINVFKDGRLSLGGVAMDRSGLERTLKGAAQRNTTTPVTIRGDKEVAHGNIVDVMDLCGLAGLSNLAVGVVDSP